jgi:hypothetical protein
MSWLLSHEPDSSTSKPPLDLLTLRLFGLVICCFSQDDFELTGVREDLARLSTEMSDYSLQEILSCEPVPLLVSSYLLTSGSKPVPVLTDYLQSVASVLSEPDALKSLDPLTSFLSQLAIRMPIDPIADRLAIPSHLCGPDVFAYPSLLTTCASMQRHFCGGITQVADSYRKMKTVRKDLGVAAAANLRNQRLRATSLVLRTASLLGTPRSSWELASIRQLFAAQQTAGDFGMYEEDALNLAQSLNIPVLEARTRVGLPVAVAAVWALSENVDIRFNFALSWKQFCERHH